ncbi:hypothetical protein [Mesorhizobium sp. B2-4-17]|uniref:hypothetical protein n=1 Tax=Mesorhizobium sp. B2-4-17 TaxID=2589932 RepID=UPI00112D917E|nr:hypothetical protein [Mesorhizobium sp. B2-4-17]TPK78218.1 hypothetical protein FJ548_25125 [Mesorhizobium sp. B2-4-17]
MTETNRTTTSEAYDAAFRLIRSAHRRDGETLPAKAWSSTCRARPDRDDDILLLDCLRRMEAADGHAGRYTGTFVYVSYQDGEIIDEHTLGFNTMAKIESFLSRVKPGQTCNVGWLVDRHTGEVLRWEVTGFGVGHDGKSRCNWTMRRQTPCRVANLGPPFVEG